MLSLEKDKVPGFVGEVLILGGSLGILDNLIGTYGCGNMRVRLGLYAAVLIVGWWLWREFASQQEPAAQQPALPPSTFPPEWVQPSFAPFIPPQYTQQQPMFSPPPPPTTGDMLAQHTSSMQPAVTGLSDPRIQPMQPTQMNTIAPADTFSQPPQQGFRPPSAQSISTEPSAFAF